MRYVPPLLMVVVVVVLAVGCIGGSGNQVAHTSKLSPSPVEFSQVSPVVNPKILTGQLFLVVSPEVRHVHVAAVDYENGSVDYVAVVPERYDFSNGTLHVTNGDGLYYEVSQRMGDFFWRVYPLVAPFNITVRGGVSWYYVDSPNSSALPSAVAGFYDFVLNLVEPVLSENVLARVFIPPSVPVNVSVDKMKVLTGSGFELAMDFWGEGYYYVNITAGEGSDILRGHFFSGSFLPVMAGFLRRYSGNESGRALAFLGDCTGCVRDVGTFIAISNKYRAGMPVVLMRWDGNTFH